MRISFGLTIALFSLTVYADSPVESSSPPTSAAPDALKSAPAAFEYLSPDRAPKLPAPPKHYSPPPGFAGYKWGEPRRAFTRLPENPAGISAAWSRGVVTSINIDCQTAGFSICSLEDYLRAARFQRFEGGGFHVLSEYFIENQGFRFSGSGVVFSPVVYQFCATWTSEFHDVPKDIEKLNKFCGVRLLFETESRAQLRDLPEDHVTRYDLVLAELMSHYGKPANYSWRGHVEIEPISQPAARRASGERRFDTWRWCPAPRDGLMTRCASSIVLTLDPDLGRGIVLVSTPELWQYAMARESGPAKPDRLYTLLHALSLKYRTAYAQHEMELRKAREEKEAGKHRTTATRPGESAPRESGDIKPVVLEDPK